MNHSENTWSRDLAAMIGRVPEPQLWRALQEIARSGAELDPVTFQRLDGHMQGFLFLQEHIDLREARIAFARSPRHMPYLRDAAGSRNVWMTDAEFGDLVEQDDAETLACFARCEDMDPHHLLYIEYKLARQPHGNDALADAYDAMITTKKALDRRGATRDMALMRLAKAALEGSADIETSLAARLRRSVAIAGDEPRALWRAYLNLRALDVKTLVELVERGARSSERPSGASGARLRSVH